MHSTMRSLSWSGMRPPHIANDAVTNRTNTTAVPRAIGRYGRRRALSVIGSTPLHPLPFRGLLRYVHHGYCRYVEPFPAGRGYRAYKGINDER